MCVRVFVCLRVCISVCVPLWLWLRVCMSRDTPVSLSVSASAFASASASAPTYLSLNIQQFSLKSPLLLSGVLALFSSPPSLFLSHSPCSPTAYAHAPAQQAGAETGPRRRAQSQKQARSAETRPGDGS